MKNEKAFTLIEVVIAFAIFLILTSMIPVFFKVLQPIDPKVRQRIETNLFFLQVSYEVQQARSVSVNNCVLYLTVDDHQTVSYDVVNEKVRRQVNGRGQEMVLLNTKNVNYEKTEKSIRINVNDTYGQSFEQRISFLVPKGG